MNPRQRARVASLERWGRTPDRAAATAPARRAMENKFIREVEAEFPDATPQEQAAMADSRRRAHFIRMAALATEARSQKRQQRERKG